MGAGACVEALPIKFLNGRAWLALIPLKGPLSAWPFCENQFQKKTQITPLGMAEHLRDPPEC